jgi:ribose transport system substrate-binding protein
MRKLSILILALGLGILVAGCGGGDQTKTEGTKPAEGGKKYQIAVIPKGTTHEFWKSIHAGALKAANELGDVEIRWQGPEKEDDRNQQQQLVENLVSQKVSAIVLAPLDDKALVPPVKQATSQKIPVVIIDSGLSAEVGKDFASFVATDNEKGGSIAGENLAKLVGSKKGAKVLILRYQEGSQSTVMREKGFVEAIKKAGITLIDPGQYAGPTQESAQQAADNLLARYKDMDGIFCPNESSTVGMLMSIKSHNLAGKVKFVGFDSSEKLVTALKAGEINGLVLQNPMKMGELGVKTAYKVLKGEKVDPRVDTGVSFVTKDNMDQPDMKALISPDLSILK